MVLGAFRGWVRIVRGGAGARASQLIRGVRRTPELANGKAKWPASAERRPELSASPDEEKAS